MSKHDKEISNHIGMLDGVTFASCIMAAFSMADTDNVAKLAREFPSIVVERYIRYHGPGGCASATEWAREFGEDNPPDFIVQKFERINGAAWEWLTSVQHPYYIERLP